MHARWMAWYGQQSEAIRSCRSLQAEQHDAVARLTPVNHIALGTVDDIVLTLFSGGGTDLFKRVATCVLGEGEAAIAHISFLLVAKRCNVMALLDFISSQQDGYRAHQRADDIHRQATVAEAKLFCDQRIGYGLDCSRPTE